jgi:hypothetical protein
MKRKRDRDRDEERERVTTDIDTRGDAPFFQGEPDYSIISKEERENAELVLKHNLPAFLVRQLQAKGKIKSYEGRMSLSCTLRPETLQFIREMGAEWGLNQGRAIDKIIDLVKGALKQSEEIEGGERKESMVERSARRRSK